jgi:hypothetical protein
VREYWIIGGEYASTAFDRLAEGATEERHCPYGTLDDAMRQWRRLSFRRIDECQVRYHIVETNDAPPARNERVARAAKGEISGGGGSTIIHAE